MGIKVKEDFKGLNLAPEMTRSTFSLYTISQFGQSEELEVGGYQAGSWREATLYFVVILINIEDMKQ